MQQLSGPGTFPLAVVGESHYQAELEAICGPRKWDGEDREIEAVLVLDDLNPHDNLAVRVEIGGKTVGHLGREEAQRYRKTFPGVRQAACQALISGGWERSKRDRGHYGVRLDVVFSEKRETPPTSRSLPQAEPRKNGMRIVQVLAILVMLCITAYFFVLIMARLF